MTLRCTLEIVPFGEEDKKKEIVHFDIFNKGYVSFGHCAYGVIEYPEKGDPGLYDEEVLHRRDLGAERLVQKVLEMRSKYYE